MPDPREIADGHRYEPDERKYFCRHCGRAAWRHERLAGVRAGLDAAANLCGALAETTYDSADAFDAAVGCESFIRALDPASVGADHDAA